MDELKSLIARSQSGDVDAYARIVRRFQDMACGYGYSILGDFHLAEDAAQEAFVEAFRCLDKLRAAEAFPGWFRRILFKRCDRLRRGKHVPTAPLEAAAGVAADHPTPAVAVEKRELDARVLAAIRALPRNQRVVTTLFYINGYSNEDIGQFISRPVGTVKRWLHDARERLRKELVAMVESELKQSRPGVEFADRVVKKISRLQVWLDEKAQASHPRGYGSLLLTDFEQRSFLIMIATAEAQAIQPWLSGQGSPDDLDIYAATVRALGRFERGIKEVTVSELKANTFYAVLKVQTGKRVVDVDCRPSDALNLAVRCNAPIYVSEGIAETCLIRDEDGKPTPPDMARQRIGVPPVVHTFRDISELLAALEKNPESRIARLALREASPGFKCSPRLLLNDKDALVELGRWVKRMAGTKLEGPAAGLLGAVHLAVPPQQPLKAIPYLERAYKLLPQDKRVAFDLCAAYAMAGKADEAFSILEKAKFPWALGFGNLSKLWKDPRFRSVVGQPDPKCRNMLFWPQLGWNVAHGKRPKGSPAPERMKRMRRLAKISQSKAGQLAQTLGCGRVLRVTGASLTAKVPGAERLLLEVEQGPAVALGLTPIGSDKVAPSLRRIRAYRPLTHDAVCNILDAARLRVDAVALLKQKDSCIEAAMLLGRGRRREAIALEGIAALAIAFTANCPILIPENLADQLRSLVPAEDKLSEDHVTEGVGYGQIMLGMSKAEIIKLLGEPEHQEKTKEGADWLVYHRGHGVDFWIADWEGVGEIRFNEGFEKPLRSGVRIGSTMDEVFRAYGTPVRTEKVPDGSRLGFEPAVLYETRDLYKISYPQRGLIFWFNNDDPKRVTQFVTFLPST